MEGLPALAMGQGRGKQEIVGPHSRQQCVWVRELGRTGCGLEERRANRMRKDRPPRGG